MYIVTKYWTNGEDWEDFYDDEVPVAYYDNMEDLLKDIDQKGWVKTDKKNEDICHIMTFDVHYDEIEFVCPYNEDFCYCEMECWGGYEKYEIYGGDENNYPEIFSECEEFRYKTYDNSSTSYKIYDIKGGVDQKYE